MRVLLSNTNPAKKLAKAIKKARPEISHCSGLEIASRVFGYRNWHEFHHVCERNRQKGIAQTSLLDATETSGRFLLEDRLSKELQITRDEAQLLLVRMFQGGSERNGSHHRFAE